MQAYGYGAGSLCGATGGWPSSYCGNPNYMGSFCEEYQCNSDCSVLGFTGGYCLEKCYCWRPVSNPVPGLPGPVEPDSISGVVVTDGEDEP